jgi:hypothetical protein
MVREKRKMALFFKNLSGNIYDYAGCWIRCTLAFAEVREYQGAWFGKERR